MGTIVVLLTGPYRGRRVVYLKQLKQSGLLLVTGPFAVNGVPLRRVSQRFVIVTSTKLDVSNLSGLEEVEDPYFKRTKQSKNQKEKQKFPEDKKKVQLKIDNQILETVKKTELIRISNLILYDRSWSTSSCYKVLIAIKRHNNDNLYLLCCFVVTVLVHYHLISQSKNTRKK